MGAGKGGRKREPSRLYRRDGIYYARVIVNGAEHRESLRTGDRAEAERRLKPWLEKRSPYHGTIRRTFEDAAELWLEAGDWKEKTLKGYAKLLRVLNAHLGTLYWDQIDKARLQWLVEELKKPRPPKNKGAGIATINRYLSVVSGIADHVRELPGWPEVNPVKLLPRKPRRARKWHYIRPPASTIEAYFARMHGTFGDIARLALLTGARLDELVKLKATDADNGKLQLWQTKHRFRVIPLSAEALAIVQRQPESKTGHLFVTSNGGPYKRASEMWREVVKRAQAMAQREGRILQHMRFHDLRHEYAIRYLESGGSLYTLQMLLGHSTIKQTEEYLHYLTPEQSAAVKT